VAATSLAARVAEEHGCKLGGTVGYTVRFDDKSNPDSTRLKFVTDGTLLQEVLSDPLLERYDVLFVDEAHERSLQTDIVLGFLKQIQAKRKQLVAAESKKQDGKPITPLKVIVMSATLDAKLFSKFFDKYAGSWMPFESI
jgi:ATP-dependent RNA helicase DHX33